MSRRNLTIKQVHQVDMLSAWGFSAPELSEVFGVSYQGIQRIRSRSTYQKVPKYWEYDPKHGKRGKREVTWRKLQLARTLILFGRTKKKAAELLGVRPGTLNMALRKGEQ